MKGASKRNLQPVAIDIRKVRQIVITFDEQHLPADIIVELASGGAIHIGSIEETNLSDEHRVDWKSYTGLFAEPNLMVQVSIGGAR